jgi:hypothetical protein
MTTSISVISGGFNLPDFPPYQVRQVEATFLFFFAAFSCLFFTPYQVCQVCYQVAFENG